MIDVDIRLKRKHFDLVVKQSFKDGITGIYGPSGSGKTSLFHAIAGLAKPESGYIYVNYRSVYDIDRKIDVPVNERRIGYVFQEGRLFPHLTVRKNLLYGYKKDTEQLITFNEVVSLLNLNHLLDSKPMQMSGGERQRTALGRALLSSPEILLLDEPFSAVDAQLRGQILPFIHSISKRVDIPILVVSHEITDLLKLTQRLCIIEEGKCLGHDDYAQLLKMKRARSVIGHKVSVNTLDVVVDEVDINTGIVKLSHEAIDTPIKAIYDVNNYQCVPDSKVKLYIKSDDISFAKNYIDGISIHNQIKGVITDVITSHHVNICVVDVGVPLVVEITASSVKKMNIHLGCDVWCLFKSVALDMCVSK